MTTTAATDLGRFSLYVGPNEAHIREAANIGGAVAVSGVTGPEVVKRLRRLGWDSPVVFDAAGYTQRAARLDPRNWTTSQRLAGAHEVLTPGSWIPWGTDVASAVRAEAAVGTAVGANPLVALDSRWLTTGIDDTIDALGQIGAPVALVLANRGDPLGAAHAVAGLVRLVRTVPDVSLLRTDHGSIGATAFGAVHASVGLRSGHRHLVPPGVRGGGIPGDNSARLFVRSLMDWFTAQRLADWRASGTILDCKLDCCDGRPLARFFDLTLGSEATRHNQTALVDLARYVHDAPPSMQRRVFAEECRQALLRYDELGAIDVEPKRQLESWVFFSSWE